MQFEVDDQLGSLLDELDEWATDRVQRAEQEALKLDVSPLYLTPHDFWTRNNLGATNIDFLMNDGAVDANGDAPRPEIDDHEPQMEALRTRLETCEMLLGNVDAALSDLDKIETQHKLVADKTHSLHEVCKRLLAEQTRLDKVVSGIQGPMTYFVSYDDIAPRFGVKSDNVDSKIKVRVLHPDDAQFKRDLARIDECIAFLEAHPHYRDQSAYLSKFRGLQTQAMNMVKAWVSDEINRLAESATIHLKSPTTSINTSTFLESPYLYSRFIEKGKILRSSILEMEKRPSVSGSALRECLLKICATRRRLLSGLVASNPEIQSKDPSLVNRILVGASFLSRVCAAELQVVSSFVSLTAAKQILSQTALNDDENDFNSTVTDRSGGGNNDGDSVFDSELFNSAEANPFSIELESLCLCFYDALRPMVIKEQDLAKLCDASSAIEDAIQDMEGRMDQDGVEPLERIIARVAFDIQERLMFCAVRVIRDTVVGYEIDQAALTASSSGGGPDQWYPTLENTLSTLSKVYRCVEPAVFEQLASEAVSACTKSLCDAAKILARRTNSPDDGDLFLIKHLLILREQISPFRAALSVKEHRLDFGSTSRALRQLFVRSSQQGGLGGRRSDWMTLMKFAAPTVRENDVDTKKELDAELRKASESYILRTSRKALGPLLEFVDATQAYLQQENATWEGLSGQSFASKQQVVDAVAYCEANTISSVEAAKEKSSHYLANPQTRSVLFNAVEANAFKVVNSAANFALDLFKDDAALNERLRELVRQVASMRTVLGSPTPSRVSSRGQSPRAE